MNLTTMKINYQVTMNKIHKTWMAGALYLAMTSLAQAQWQEQELKLVPGWNSVYLHVDSTHSGIADLATNTQVEEVWLWQPDLTTCLLYTSPSPRDRTRSRMPSSA